MPSAVLHGLLSLATVVFLIAGPVAFAQEGDWDDDDWGDDWGDESLSPSPWTGFLELGLGARTGSDPVIDDDLTLGELRLRLETDRDLGAARLGFKGDVYYDAVTDQFEGELREMALSFSPVSSADLKIGRQVLTWGTGDFVFLNDLFPKDFQSFFSGRDDEYLKAPSDTIRASWFGDAFNVDVAWSPEFEPDRYLTGERFSFFSPPAGTIVAPDSGRVGAPDEFPEDGEIAVRIFANASGAEWALYGYRGFFKGPEGLAMNGQLFFPRLNVWGASLRRPLGPGLINAEVACYDSRDDSDGTNPGVPNDQLRFLLGYEQELITNLTLGLQGYLERTLDHSALLAASPAPSLEPEHNRAVLTARLTYRAFRDRLTAGLFTFASPTDGDYHLRPSITYRWSDEWTFTAGANLFGGDDRHTFFNHLSGNENVFVRARYNF
ncbi:MAG: hypothetical protein R3200_10020 [Xanthomonadales bacterium]|nr:hypothetical protein [Xanthomonadales bacterium]